MTEATWIILLHQLLFQGLFVIKNLSLKLKLGQPIRGDNPEANAAVLFFVVFILTSLYLAMGQPGAMSLQLLPQGIATGLCLLLLCCNLLFGVAALRDLGESWRVGVIEEQQTTLVESGVYRFPAIPISFPTCCCSPHTPCCCRILVYWRCPSLAANWCTL